MSGECPGEMVGVDVFWGFSGQIPKGAVTKKSLVICTANTRWAPTSYKWSYNPYKSPYNWVTGVITPISGVITILITGRGPTL